MAKSYEAIKAGLQRLGYVRPGSLVRRFMPCGKPSCRCMSDPPALHGPYYQWTLRIQGKTKTVRLNEYQARLCEEWIANHKKLKDIIRRMEAMSLKETDRLLRKAP
jgi:hypothetical protein